MALETRIVTQEEKKRGSERRLEGMRKEKKQGYEQRWEEEEEEEKKRYDGWPQEIKFQGKMRGDKSKHMREEVLYNPRIPEIFFFPSQRFVDWNSECGLIVLLLCL